MTRTLEQLEILGTALCLDFANTVSSRPAPEHDYLGSYAELVGWAQRAGLLAASEAAALARQGDPARKAWQQALRQRELIYLTFSAAARGTAPKRETMAKVMEGYAAALGAAQYVAAPGGGYQPTWPPGQKPETLLWPIWHSAGALLLSPELSKTKECPSCGWLFVDRSKNGSRRWCNMNVCGAREKMRRYQQRQRGA